MPTISELLELINKDKLTLRYRGPGNIIADWRENSVQVLLCVNSDSGTVTSWPVSRVPSPQGPRQVKEIRELTSEEIDACWGKTLEEGRDLLRLYPAWPERVQRYPSKQSVWL